MKSIVLFIGLFFVIGNTIDINNVRSLYKNAKDSKENTENFYQLTKQGDYLNNHTLAGYYGCAMTLKASFSEKREDKISFFKQGRQMIEAAIIADSTNIELRMIRLSVQTQAPKITRYHKNIEGDKTFILDHIDAISSSTLKGYIKGFMSSSKLFIE